MPLHHRRVRVSNAAGHSQLQEARAGRVPRPLHGHTRAGPLLERQARLELAPLQRLRHRLPALGLSDHVRGGAGGRDRRALPRQVLLHSRERGQDRPAHTHHLPLQEDTRLLSVPLVRGRLRRHHHQHRYQELQKQQQQVVTRQLQTILLDEPLQLLLRLLSRLVRLLHAHGQVERGRSVLHAPP